MTTARTAARIAVHTLVRAGALALVIVAYDAVYDRLLPSTPGDADIGKGLLAFLLIALVCLVWGAVDGAFLPPVVWVSVWLLVAVVVGVGWEVVPGTGGSGGDVDPVALAFTAQLVAVPGLVGAGFGWLVRGRTR